MASDIRDRSTHARLLRPWPDLGFRPLLVGLLLLVAYGWALSGTDVHPASLWRGLPAAGDFLRRLFPPAWKLEPMSIAGTAWVVPMPEVALAIVETVQMALVATTAATVIALPIGLLAARTTSPHAVVYQTTRFALNVIRAVPDIIYGLMFVAAVGLGPFSGVLALTVGALGSMGKLYAEAIESIDPNQVRAIVATGATRGQTVIFGVMPQALPLVASYAILLFEVNVRSASVLGLVGAGGVGFLLSKYMALFQYQYLIGALILLVTAVTA
ncbi:MAG: phosphonate ABC transporter, permease protein PhnE, partial [Vicinamibacterales bacterium]